MALVSKTFRIFVSSTFSDLKEERNALQKRVFPKLRELCMQYGAKFQAIDLRWGVREEAALDQQTMKICLEEIARCQKITPRPNFIVLLGDRYGWRPLPSEIPADEFEKIRLNVKNEEDKALLTKWYKRDDNAVPPVYCLQPREVKVKENATEEEKKKAREEEAKEWSKIEQKLRKIFLSAIPNIQLTEEQKLKYIASATEQEITAGAMKVPDAHEHVFCFFREIKNLPEDKSAKDFIDLDENGKRDINAHTRLKELKTHLRKLLPGNIQEYETKWTEKGITTNHLDKLCEEVYDKLSSIILKEVVRIKEVDPLENEIDEHSAFGKERAKFFIGRASILEAISDYIEGESNRVFAIFGEPGSGKSALIARAVEQALNEYPDSELVFRFIGATPSSSDGRALLETLCRQISRIYEADESDIPTDYKELVEEFPKRLELAREDKPLIIFIDALDQLSDAHNARNLIWLPSELPENVRLIVSTLPGECLETLKRKLSEDNFQELEPMPLEEGEALLDLWLKSAERTLQENQRKEVLDKFNKCGLPLYLKLAFEEARRWKSYTKDCELSSDIQGIIRDLFTRLSSDANHGEMMVSRSLGYIAAGKNGLSEDELLDILSQDEEVFKDFMKRAYHTPPEKRLPVIVWSRLYFDLEPYLTERSADGTSLMTFYHPTTIGKEVKENYLSGKEKLKRHGSLARYFGEQPLYIEKDTKKIPNLRKLSELPYQQTNSEMWEALYETLTDFEFLEAKCTHISVITIGKGEEARRIYGGVYELMEDYHRALGKFPTSKDVK